MIRKTEGEEWKTIRFVGDTTLRKRYAVSSLGRLASFKKAIYKDGIILKGSVTAGGYKTLNLHIEKGNNSFYLHREMAKVFCKKASPMHEFVIHSNHQKMDNRVANLKWVTAEELAEHQQNSPSVIGYKHRQANREEGPKLNAKKVREIKELLADPNRKLTYKKIAEKYKISEMSIYRILNGENWAKIKAE